MDLWIQGEAAIVTDARPGSGGRPPASFSPRSSERLGIELTAPDHHRRSRDFNRLNVVP
jgi:hypothetical protein